MDGWWVFYFVQRVVSVEDWGLICLVVLEDQQTHHSITYNSTKLWKYPILFKKIFDKNLICYLNFKLISHELVILFAFR